MNQAGKVIVLIGLGIVVIGLVIWGLGRLGFRGLPGDIRYESGGTRVFIPIVTCIVLSIVLTILFNLGAVIWRWLNR